MALKKQVQGVRQRSVDSGVEPDRSLLNKEQRDQRISLFLQDFDHQARENLQEMKKELDALLQTAEKAFRVELLMMPSLIRKMRRRELILLKDAEAAATAAAISETKEGSAEDLPNPKVVRTNSKRVKVTTIVEYKDENEENRMQAKKSSRKVFKTHSLASLASAIKGKQSGTFSRSVYSTPSIRSTKKSSVDGQPVSISKCTPLGSKKLPQRVLSKSASTSERAHSITLRSTSMPSEKVPFINIPLADGQTLCSAGDDLQEINVDLLNDDTVQHIHTLVNQLTVLCGKATVKSS
ncbi:borealin-2-like [Tiliqua scincoides]|uniref:borealin-2-like n=1 Tax=Tiliqua scincoides TaxID=71010 RepID=UPI0034623E47